MSRLTTKQTLQLLKIAENTQNLSIPTDSDSAFISLMRICRDYVDNVLPLVRDEQRDKMLLERLKKYRIKYIEKI